MNGPIAQSCCFHRAGSGFLTGILLEEMWRWRLHRFGLIRARFEVIGIFFPCVIEKEDSFHSLALMFTNMYSSYLSRFMFSYSRYRTNISSFRFSSHSYPRRFPGKPADYIVRICFEPESFCRI